VEPNEIFQLIVKADEKLKYATAERGGTRTAQARELLVRARDEAAAIGNGALVAQAEQRLADLAAAGATAESGLSEGETPAIAGAGPDPSPSSGSAKDLPRPTPADPTPWEAEEAGVPSARRESAPPELGTDAVAVLEGRTFMYSNSLGDVPTGSVGGLVHDDTRFLGTWVLTIDGRQPALLRSHTVDYYSAAFFLTNPELPGLSQNTLSIRRRRFVGNGMREEISIHSFSDEPVRFELRLATGTDFADLFEMKAEVRDRSEQIEVEQDQAHSGVIFRYANQSFHAETHVHATGGVTCRGTDLVWEVELPPRGHWETELFVRLVLRENEMELIHDEFGEEQVHDDHALGRWLAEVPHFTSYSETLVNVVTKSVNDLAALRISGEVSGQRYTFPAAGLPWFMTFFGRDTLITSYQSLWVGPELAKGALRTLASLQGTKVDDFRDEEPGRILHEVRYGELTVLGLKPHSPYYGAVDSTQLWLILLSEYHRWTHDDDLVHELWNSVKRALEWIDTYGDRDGDGFVEYGTRSPQGLGNQTWKDSWDGIQFAKGGIPYLPIAICEAQGYVYDAKLRIAELAERCMDDPELAARLRKEADELYGRFNEAFWVDARGGYYAVGLDADKRQIDSMTSNMGHLLWSGIVPEDRAAVVARQLMSDPMFSGWGVRTMSTQDAGFNPIGYHLGTIWPHDNSIIAAGFARYGLREEANRIILAQLEAAKFSEFRLPEAFAGFDRNIGRFPVPYPTACSPQAWATGAPFLFLQTLLGVQARDGALTCDPMVPPQMGRVLVNGMHAFGTHYDVDATETKGEVGLTH